MNFITKAITIFSLLYLMCGCATISSSSDQTTKFNNLTDYKEMQKEDGAIEEEDDYCQATATADTDGNQSASDLAFYRATKYIAAYVELDVKQINNSGTTIYVEKGTFSWMGRDYAYVRVKSNIKAILAKIQKAKEATVKKGQS